MKVNPDPHLPELLEITVPTKDATSDLVRLSSEPRNASVLASSGMSLPIIGALLGHTILRRQHVTGIFSTTRFGKQPSAPRDPGAEGEGGQRDSFRQESRSRGE